MLRKNKRALDKAIRDLDRERSRMEQQEKKIIADIKKMAKEGQMVQTTNIVPQLLHEVKNTLFQLSLYFHFRSP